MDPPLALCIGDVSEELIELFGDVLSEIQIPVRAVLSENQVPTLVLLGVGTRDVKRAVTRARREVGAVPLVAVLPIQDPRLAAAALRSGADACYALGTPLTRLRVLIAQLLISHWVQPLVAHPPPGLR